MGESATPQRQEAQTATKISGAPPRLDAAAVFELPGRQSIASEVAGHLEELMAS